MRLQPPLTDRLMKQEGRHYTKWTCDDVGQRRSRGDHDAHVWRRMTVEMTQSQLQSKVVTTACGMCYVGCGVKVRVEDGVVVNIEGNPDNPLNRGKMCAKGKSAFMTHYNPHRVKTPLRRTNSEKGFGG